MNLKEIVSNRLTMLQIMLSTPGAFEAKRERCYSESYSVARIFHAHSFSFESVREGNG